jgi:L-alanine-DL-glutamate epimerase-like enolase superfamily enzyme
LVQHNSSTFKVNGKQKGTPLWKLLGGQFGGLDALTGVAREH